MASILETLVIKYVADYQSLTKGSDAASKSTKKVEESFRNADKALKKHGDQVKKLVKKYGGLVAAYFSITRAFRGFVSSLDYVDKIDRLSDMIGVNISQLDAWSKSVEQAGGDVDGFLSSVQSLTKDLSQFQITGGSGIVPYLQLIGVNVTDANGKIKEVMDLLPDMAEAFQKAGKQRSFEIGKQIGLDNGTITLLQKGKEGVDRLLKSQKELGLVTKKSAAVMRDFKDSWQKARFAFERVALSVGSLILPAVTKMLGSFRTFVRFLAKNKDLVVGFVTAIGIAITTFLLPALIKAAIAALALYWPILLVVGIVSALAAAFALLYEDFMAFQKGNDSAIGSIFKKYPLVKRLVMTLIDTFKLLFKVVKGVFGFLLFSVTEMFSKLQSFVGFISGLAQKIKSLFSGNNTVEVDANLKTAQSTLQSATAFPLQSVTSNGLAAAALGSSVASTTSSNSVSVGEVNVNAPGGDPSVIAAEIRNGLENEFKKAVVSFSDGVVA